MFLPWIETVSLMFVLIVMCRTLLKTAMVYGGFLGTSANLRYQIIAGLIEHRISDELSSQPLLVNVISFVVRTLNSYFGTQQWIDLARSTGLQTQKSILASEEITEPLEESTTVESKATEEESIDKLDNQ
ncbi:unnamed protein product [Microthlaspi erraticum]|uniref:Uncharacterized protein n=1 Tax=Microthlaspi erraticum TaxID=1685480 RepID=A0A6D2IG29_9BRAS|nr:unnamed protein product [Microthlaspi erraticum]